MADVEPRFHPRAKRLIPVWLQAQQAEQKGLAEWGRMQQQLQQELAQQQQLQEYANDYRQQLATPGQASLTGSNIQNLLQFLGQIEQAGQAQSRQIEQLKARIVRAQQHYLALKSKTDGLASLMDKLDLEFHQQQAKQEQRQADEWANRKAFLNRQG
ncbi:flagellar export protein FliJ [Oceanobacter mangrovi]|uniref:flagellar export protein FliJ n=1 Tax=Oceanobacter mangrovi TaxID=2862510 RepID=UPI001C8E94B2|nr:flagellar FliJ family protein [Oceanobacter mangrovi]